MNIKSERFHQESWTIKFVELKTARSASKHWLLCQSPTRKPFELSYISIHDLFTHPKKERDIKSHNRLTWHRIFVPEPIYWLSNVPMRIHFRMHINVYANMWIWRLYSIYTDSIRFIKAKVCMYNGLFWLARWTELLNH